MTFIDLESCKKFVEAEQMLYKEVPLLRKFQKDYLEGMVWYEQMLYKEVPLLRKFQKDYLEGNST